MTKDGMELVGLFQLPVLLFGQLDVQGGNGLIEMLHPGGADRGP